MRYILDPHSTQAAATPPSLGKLLSDYLLFSPSGTLQADTQTTKLATTANQAAVSTSTFHKILSGLGEGFTQELSQQWNSLKSLQTEMAMSINGSSDSAMNASLGNRSLYELAQVTPDEPPLITKQDLIDMYTGFKNGDAYSRSVMVGKGGALVSEALILKRIGLFDGGAVEIETDTPLVSNIPTARQLAQQVTASINGQLTQLENGYKVAIPFGNREIVIRLMEQGGGRENYYRVSIDGKQTFTKSGDVSTDRALTHMNIEEASHNDIVNIIRSITNDYKPANTP